MAKKSIEYYTPVGTFRWPNFEVARAFKEGEDPTFDGGLVFDPKVLKQVKKDLEDISKKLIVGTGYDPEEDGKLALPIAKDKKNGEEYFKAKSYKKPAVTDAKANDVPPSVTVGGGSTGRMHVFLSYYKMGRQHGISARLIGVQVKDLVERNVKSSFGELEGGYVYEGSEDETRPEARAEDMADF